MSYGKQASGAVELLQCVSCYCNSVAIGIATALATQILVKQCSTGESVGGNRPFSAKK
jgi:hypothetical protein